MSSKISHRINKRIIQNDIFITPVELAKFHINTIKGQTDNIWHDPFRNNGVYYNNYPVSITNRRWSEILKGRDFLTESIEPGAVICSNPPYSILDMVIKRCIELDPLIISFLIGVGNLTARRIDILEKAGYKIIFLHMCKVYKWYGMSYIVNFQKQNNNGILSYDRVVWKEDK